MTITGIDIPGLPPLETAGRIAKLRERLAREQLDCVVVTALANVRYLTGFTGSAAVLVVTSDQALLATDGRYRTQADEQLSGRFRHRRGARRRAHRRPARRDRQDRAGRARASDSKPSTSRGRRKSAGRSSSRRASRSLRTAWSRGSG